MKPTPFVKNLKRYPVISHKVWEYKDKRGVLKLDWNEGDVILPSSIKKDLINFIRKGPLSWYPDVLNKKLIKALASFVKVPPDYIQYFEGSDAALDYVVRTFVSYKDEVILIAPTYDNFRVFVESVGGKIKNVFGKDIFSPDLSNIAKNITGFTKLVYLVNPNNPTGTLYSLNEIKKLLQKKPKTIFLIDEAYGEFVGSTVASLTRYFPNLIVSKTFSKAFGLASFRLGYIISSPKNIKEIDKIRNGKNIPMLAQIAALSALKNKSYMKKYVKEVKQTREFTLQRLRGLGFTVKNTPANFILIKVKDPFKFQKVLVKEKIFVRSLAHLPKMRNYIRVTIGRKKTMKEFISRLKKLLKHGKISPETV